VGPLTAKAERHLALLRPRDGGARAPDAPPFVSVTLTVPARARRRSSARETQ